MPEPHDRCAGCDVEFGYTTEDDPAAMCRLCETVMHTDCLQGHVCPKRLVTETQRMKDWEKAARSWRPASVPPRGYASVLSIAAARPVLSRVTATATRRSGSSRRSRLATPSHTAKPRMSSRA